MLNSLSIRNFQSLHHVDITLAPLTVIVGASSSGKSAFTRALRTLTSNQRGTAFISTGQTQCSITAATDKGTVSLHRGSNNSYTVIPNDAPQLTFTKLNGSTPEEVTEFLGINPSDPLNFSSQFDKPYLLDDSPAEVARTLGALTNVNVIFEASREANRQRLAYSQTLNTRTQDLASLKEEFSRAPALNAQLTALSSAEDILTRASIIRTQLTSLSQSLEVLTEAAQRLRSIRRIVPPDISALTTAHRTLTALHGSIAALKSAAQQQSAAQQHRKRTEEELDRAQEDYYAAVSKLGRDIASYMKPHSIEGNIMVVEAGELAAQYIAENLT